MTDEQYFDAAIDWAKSRGFSDIKANYSDFEKPTTYSKPNEEEPYIPDITAMRIGNKCYIEIATKTDSTRRKVSKWKLLSTLALMKGGKLFLLAPKGHKAFVEDLLKKNSLNAQLIYLAKV